jgi:hypothetical protein
VYLQAAFAVSGHGRFKRQLKCLPMRRGGVALCLPGCLTRGAFRKVFELLRFGTEQACDWAFADSSDGIWEACPEVELRGCWFEMPFGSGGGGGSGGAAPCGLKQCADRERSERVERWRTACRRLLSESGGAVVDESKGPQLTHRRALRMRRAGSLIAAGVLKKGWVGKELLTKR